MKKIDQGHAIALILALSLVACLVNVTLPEWRRARVSSYNTASPIARPSSISTPSLTSQQMREMDYTAKAKQAAEDEAQAKRAAQQAADEHARYLKRYLHSSLERSSGKVTAAVVIATSQGELDPDNANALASRLASESTMITTDLFTPAFAADGLFSEIYGGSLLPLEQLELTQSLDFIALGRESIEYVTNLNLENVITASAKLEIVILPVAGRGQKQKRVLTANGAGFKREAARNMAIERLTKEIANSPSLSATALSFSKY